MNQDQYHNLIDQAESKEARVELYNEACKSWSRAKGIRAANKDGLMLMRINSDHLSKDVWPRQRIALIARQLKLQVPQTPSRPTPEEYGLDTPCPMMDEYTTDPKDEEAWNEGYNETARKWGYQK